MKTNIFIPKRINVGYQERSDTYTGKLGYIIYYDEKGKLRKETSWQNWRDDSIPSNEFENEPIKGFILNKKAGGYKYSWNTRQTYCRVFDPRGFEFEITIENLLYILEYCSCINKALDVELVYGWDGTELVLLPINSPEYEEIKDFTNKVITSNLKTKDLIIGASYLGKDNNTYIYMGKFNYYGMGYMYIDDRGNIISTKDKDNIPYRYNLHNKIYIDHCYRNIDYGKYHWFATEYECNGRKCWDYKTYKSLPKLIIECVSTEKYKYLNDVLEDVKNSVEFSPIDDSKTKLILYNHDDFMNILMQNKLNDYGRLAYKGIFSKSGFSYLLKYDKKSGLWNILFDGTSGNYILRESDLREGRNVDLHYKDFQERFNGDRKSNVSKLYARGDDGYDYDYFCKGLKDEELFTKLEPGYVITYLKNGNEHKKYRYYNIN